LPISLRAAIAAFGADAKAKLTNPAARGQPEDQLRAPLERLLADLAELCGLPRDSVAAVGESSLGTLRTRPDYAITRENALVGFIEVKAPGKGADPRRFKDRHDREQWEKLESLPNLIYADGNDFGLWRYGQLIGKIVRLHGDIETSGSGLDAPAGLLGLFDDFLQWNPIPPDNAKHLAELSARLCRLLREEVVEQLAVGSPALTRLATDWRVLLFPDASDSQFADGYAQAVTFGLLMARARDIDLGDGLDRVARELGQTNSLIGTALRVLTDDAENQATLKTSMGTLTRVLNAVSWQKISRGDPEAWLYFYEDFLEVYDNRLRKQTGSYYTPPEAVAAMVGLVNQALRFRFGLHNGLASPEVTIVDPAAGTGTFFLGTLRKIAETIGSDQGVGAVPAAIEAALQRLIAFEIQLGPFAVAQLRVAAELVEIVGTIPTRQPRMFVTDTLSDPYLEQRWLPAILAPIAESRRQANEVKKNEPITVVIGNPPYKEKARGHGSWIESGGTNSGPSQLADWIPPTEWGVGAHAKHLRNMYVYFWRWATWKVFDHDPNANTGIVCFITVAGFLAGPGFPRMREYLRQKCDDIWVIDCSPEGHQPEVNTRIFQGVQQPVCIVLASRSVESNSEIPARVHFQALPAAHREEKLKALGRLELGGSEWIDCPLDWRAPFRPAATGAWADYPALEEFFVYNGSGVQPKRTWVVAPDVESLLRRWERLVGSPRDEKEDLFHPTLRDGKPADRHIRSIVEDPIPGFVQPMTPLINEKGPCLKPVQYGFRSFNRQWIIPDARVITQPNAELWRSRSDRQVYLTALSRTSPTSGPALTVTGLVPDLDHYKGSFGGRVFPLWRDRDAQVPNVRPQLLSFLAQRYSAKVSAEDLLAYLVSTAAHAAFTATFQEDLSTPGLRIPLTADADFFAEATELGRSVIWLHTFGERMADSAKGRLHEPPRLRPESRPRVPADGAIPQSAAGMPNNIDYDASKRRLQVGSGWVENVTPQVWSYTVSGKQVLRHWFSYRKANREKPIIGQRRQPSALGDIQPDHWLPEYTAELLDVLNVLGRLIELEPIQAALLTRIVSGPLVSSAELLAAGALRVPEARTPQIRRQAKKLPLLD